MATIQRSLRKCGIIVAIDGSEDQINIRGFNSYQVPKNVGPLKPEDHPNSDVEHFNSDSNGSDLSEASDSDSVVSFEQVIIDWLIAL